MGTNLCSTFRQDEWGLAFSVLIPVYKYFEKGCYRLSESSEILILRWSHKSRHPVDDGTGDATV